MRWYSMAGMMAMSTALVRKASAHWDGNVKDRSYLPLSGPLVKDQTKGVVFRYLTIEMRSFGKVDVFPARAAMVRAFRGRVSIADIADAIWPALERI